MTNDYASNRAKTWLNRSALAGVFGAAKPLLLHASNTYPFLPPNAGTGRSLRGA